MKGIFKFGVWKTSWMDTISTPQEKKKVLWGLDIINIDTQNTIKYILFGVAGKTWIVKSTEKKIFY